MSNEEIHDFFVERIAPKHSRADPTHTVKADIDEHQEVNRNMILFWQKGPNDSLVRIPTLCFLGGTDENESSGFFADEYKIQSGCHVFINSVGQMESVQTYLEAGGEYMADASRRVSCVYPCYQNNKRRRTGRMLLGLKFEQYNADSAGERTFGRQKDNQSGSGGAFDLIDKYLSAGELTSYATETFNPNPPENTLLFAIYVCRGARLLVSDDRFEFSRRSAGEGLCHSLLQLGSLVVAEGRLRLEVAIKKSKEKARGKKTAQKETVGYEWSEVANNKQNSLLDPNLFNRELADFERMEKKFHLENSKPLNLQKRFVVFIGSNESELNSSAWELSMSTQSDGKATQVTYSLLAPQFGRILDIQPWEKGFEQVIARHQYERLFESVLSPIRTPDFPFKVPNEEILKRILGIEKSELAVKTPPKFKLSKEHSKSILQEPFRTVYGRDLEQTKELNEDTPYCQPPAPPPLYPPILSGQTLYYLQYGSHPHYDPKSRTFSIYSQKYELKSEPKEQFLWDYSHAIRPDETNWQSFDQSCYRLANDYRLYKKTDKCVGKALISYFVKC